MKSDLRNISIEDRMITIKQYLTLLPEGHMVIVLMHRLLKNWRGSLAIIKHGALRGHILGETHLPFIIPLSILQMTFVRRWPR